MSDEEEVVTKPRKKNPLMAKTKAKAAATKVIEKAAAKPAKGKTKVAPEPAKPKRAPKGEGPGRRQPSEEMQEDRVALLALLKRRKNGLTSVECKNELEWTSARVAATSFGLVNAGKLEKEKDPENGRVTFKFISN